MSICALMKKSRVGDVIDDEVSLITKKDGLSPGDMSESRFWLLVEISSIHSEKVITALNDHLVLGYSRREACERNKVAPGYFSLSLAKIQRIKNMVALLVAD